MDAFAMNAIGSERDDRACQRHQALHFDLRTLPRPLRIIRNKFRPKPYSPTPHSPTSTPTRLVLGPTSLSLPTPPHPCPHPLHPPIAKTSAFVTFRRPSFFSIRSSSTGTRSTLSKLARKSRKVESSEVLEGEGDGDGEGEWWWRGGPNRSQMIEAAEIDEYVRWVQWENDW
ncbi:hypothetical protein JCM5353_000572 [Sporobolomyces roseus]